MQWLLMVNVLEKTIAALDKELKSFRDTKDALSKDLIEAEESAFKDFLKANGFKTIKEYEASQSVEAIRHVNDRKNTLIQNIEKCKSELEFLQNSGNNDKGIKAIESILK